VSNGAASDGYRSLVPARLDRLPWNRFHTRVVIGLGVSWILDGLEIQVVSQIGIVLADRDVLALTSGEIGVILSVYLFGEVIGALLFGRLTDRFGRRKLFFVTLTLYLAASALSAFSVSLGFMLLCRFVAGAGIGGEYTAINSAIDELIPAYYRGRVDIMVNGTYWAGGLLGSAANVFLLDPRLLPIDLGWRISLLIGPVIGLAVIGLRTTIKESPRWLMTHGRDKEAVSVVDTIENDLRKKGIEFEEIPPERALALTGRADTSYRTIARTMLDRYRKRSILGLAMMITQSVLYNAVYLTYAQVLVRFFGVADRATSFQLLPFAAANLIGPLLLAQLFDTIGRRRMITFTYGVSGVLLAISAQLFVTGLLTAVTQTVAWCVIFFFASAGASSAYLTISEIFPLEMRAQAISFFFALSQLIGGVFTPIVFGHLIGSGTDRVPLALGYGTVAVLMILGGAVAWFLGVDAERKSLEQIANPLSTPRHDIEPPLHHG
jgi:MFS family permease